MEKKAVLLIKVLENTNHSRVGDIRDINLFFQNPLNFPVAEEQNYSEPKGVGSELGDTKLKMVRAEMAQQDLHIKTLEQDILDL